MSETNPLGTTEMNARFIKDNPLVYDLRNDLNPRRVANAMWDYSWIFGHYPDGPFADWDRATEDLLERGFNAVRIDACAWWIGHLEDAKGTIELPAQPEANWGVSTVTATHQPLRELIEFVAICARKKIHVILSTWNHSATGVPAGNKSGIESLEKLWLGWERVLKALRESGLGDWILYVDLDQEYPYFSPTQSTLNALTASGSGPGNEDAMEAAGRRNTARGQVWNDAQLDFVHAHFSRSIEHFQSRYPEFRFTFSLTGFWEEVRSLRLRCFDVLEVHLWVHGPRFDQRTGFGSVQKNRAVGHLGEYQKRIDQTLEAVRPMLLAEMHNRLSLANQWAHELAAPLITTEAWGPWWHMDNPGARWDWLKDWCEECIRASSHYQLWGSTPWNYCHPYWANWSEIAWYRKVNALILE